MNVNIKTGDIVRIKPQWEDDDMLHVSGMDCMLGKLMVVQSVSGDSFTSYHSPFCWDRSCVECVISGTNCVKSNGLSPLVQVGDYVILPADSSINQVNGLRAIEDIIPREDGIHAIIQCVNTPSKVMDLRLPYDNLCVFRPQTAEIEQPAPDIQIPTEHDLLGFLFGVKEVTA